ncbi:hypothetical protein [Micromonospora purpureochromogenes]|uniref:Uncharacterized protein n=1 Tax=Micromonospora purpureochromogenes TaxID=47872 RepID=A0ABX2RMJ6_9ACTN|nr:hypothetical protein [Micromonospora purpureochromogenes]NYF56519.1 hypothetical protein [Micromonospora purpureochromogenes]
MLLSRADRFGDLQLQGLPFDLDHSAYDRMCAAADVLPSAGTPDVQPAWESYTHEDALPRPAAGVQLLVLSATVSVVDTGQDWLELSLQVAFDTPSLLEVAAAVEVACWCTNDHNMHAVERREWLVGSGPALARSFDAAIHKITRWLATGPSEPDPWRDRAGLPSPSDRKAAHCPRSRDRPSDP